MKSLGILEGEGHIQRWTTISFGLSSVERCSLQKREMEYLVACT